jgi:hypothetical protein
VQKYLDGKRPRIDGMLAIRRPAGFDRAGMCDKFEVEDRLDQHGPADRNGDKLTKDEYTDFEAYLNRLEPDEKLP